MRLGLVLVALAGCGRIGFDAADDAAPARCGSTRLLANDFDGGLVPTDWDGGADAGVVVSASDGELAFALPAQTAVGDHYGLVRTRRGADLRDSRVFVEVTRMFSSTTHANAGLIVFRDDTTYLDLEQDGGQLTAYQVTDNVGVKLGSIAYLPATQRWWQLREAGGTVYFETSADGEAYTSFAATPTPSYAPVVTIGLIGGSYQRETGAGEARFDNLNGGVAVGQWCAAETLQDDFNAGVIDPAWRGFGANGCQFSEAGGNATFELAATGANDCKLASMMAYDLTGAAVFTAITTTPRLAGATYSYLSAESATGDLVEIGQLGTDLVCAQVAGGVFSELRRIPYDGGAHHFWQLREDRGRVFFETSPDAATWTLQLARASPISMVDVVLGVGAGTEGAVASPGTATFATFSKLPL